MIIVWGGWKKVQGRRDRPLIMIRERYVERNMAKSSGGVDKSMSLVYSSAIHKPKDEG